MQCPYSVEGGNYLNLIKLTHKGFSRIQLKLKMVKFYLTVLISFMKEKLQSSSLCRARLTWIWHEDSAVEMYVCVMLGLLCMNKTRHVFLFIGVNWPFLHVFLTQLTTAKSPCHYHMNSSVTCKWGDHQPCILTQRLLFFLFPSQSSKNTFRFYLSIFET